MRAGKKASAEHTPPEKSNTSNDKRNKKMTKKQAKSTSRLQSDNHEDDSLHSKVMSRSTVLIMEL